MDCKPQFRITPNPALLDEVVEIIVTCLRPRHHVTLLCRVEEDGVRYFSHAYYLTDEKGKVNVRTMTALPGGSYDGVEPMGWVWSQTQEPGQKPGRRLAKIDVTTPLVTHVHVLYGKVPSGECLDMVTSGDSVAYTTCDRIHMADGVQRIEVTEGRLEGTLFIPPGPGPHPGVIDLFGTIGGTVEHRSSMLASRGVAAFTVCYFTPGRGVGLVEDIEYFEEAIEYLLRHPRVQGPDVGVIGVSKGGELALLISALCHKVRACVEINGMHVVTLVDHSYRGELFPFMFLDMDILEERSDGIAFEKLYHAITPEEHEQYAIPVERGVCDYLLVHSADDRSMPPLVAEHVPRRLRAHGKSNYRILMYPGAGHLLEVPHSPHFYSTYHAMFMNVAVWGGTSRLHSRAQEDAWTQILQFFKTKLTSQAPIQHKL